MRGDPCAQPCQPAHAERQRAQGWQVSMHDAGEGPARMHADTPAGRSRPCGC
jgi:hypothetical protein